MCQNKLFSSKIYIIIAGAIASGKTTLALNLAKAIPNCFYLDKDDLGPMAEKIFEVGNEKPYDRNSPFFYENVRDVEYDVTEIMALRGLNFNDCVIVNTPYTGEIHDELFESKPNEKLRKLHDDVRARGGELMIVFIDIDTATAKKRLEKRKEENPGEAKRTPKVFDDIDGFLETQNLTVPQGATIEDADRFFVFHATQSEQSFKELKQVLNVDCQTAFDVEIAQKPFMQAVKPKTKA